MYDKYLKLVKINNKISVCTEIITMNVILRMFVINLQKNVGSAEELPSLRFAIVYIIENGRVCVLKNL